MNGSGVIDLSRAPKVLRGARIYIGHHDSYWITEEFRYAGVPMQLERLVRALGGRISKELRGSEFFRASLTTHILFQETVPGRRFAFQRDEAVSSVQSNWKHGNWCDAVEVSREGGSLVPEKGVVALSSARDFYQLCLAAAQARVDVVVPLLTKGNIAPVAGFIGI